MANFVVMGQPEASHSPGETGPVTIRTMTAEDADFVSKLSTEAFRGKISWAAGESNLERLINLQAKDYGGRNNIFFDRNFIAMYNGYNAGLLCLKLHRHMNQNDGRDDNVYMGMCCRGLCKLTCMGILLDESVPQGSAYIEQICVDSNFRGRGIGKVLLDRAEVEARNNNCNRMYLHVVQTNRAKNLYERQGYKVAENMDSCCIWCATGEKKFYLMEKMLY